MRLDLTSDQEFLRETTARFLADQVPAAKIRQLRDDPDGFTADYWRRGGELGWVSLLVGEEHGGGSVSGDGLADLVILSHEFGRHAAPGPLLSANIAALALSEAPTDYQTKVLTDLMSGTSIVAWCFEESRRHSPSDISLEVRIDGDEVELTGLKRPAESAARADHLLVTGRTGDGLTQVLVPASTPGVTVRPMQTLDLTRRFAVVSFEAARLPIDAVVGAPGKADRQVERQRQAALVISNAETVGSLDRSFEMTVEWAFDRYSFGRPLASYQELKHRFADMKTWLEACHAIADAAAGAASRGSPDADEMGSVAKAFIGHFGTELVQDCVQIHGGIGVTFEHDLHLFLRRASLNSTLLGTPAEHRQHIAAIAIEEAAR